jgi:glycosyltransferase involved in cell wall biosynthesis
MVFEVRDLWPEVPIAIGVLRSPAAIALARWLERFAYANAAHIVALAPGMKDHVVSIGYPAERVSVIPNGCDFELFGADASAPDPRLQCGWAGDRPLLVFSGTFGLVNGVDYLPKLCAHLLEIDPDICVVALGDGREFAAVRQLAVLLGVLERNFFMLGRLPKREVAAWVRTAQMTIALFTGPQIVWRDAVQNKFFDSLAAGRPIANNFVGWQAKIAVEAGAGLILDAHDTRSAARTLAKHLRDAKWLEAASRAASDLARTRFDRDSLAAELARVLEDVARADEAPARLERAR